MSALSFTFENSPVNVIVKDGEPWFIASQITKAIHLTNPSVALKSLRPIEKSKVTIEGRETNVISESGMYTLILRCQDAIKEGTPAFRFRVKVTDEILPAIRKSGKYECPANPKYITPQQGWLIQSAVQKRVHKDGVTFQTVYQALKAHFQIPKYTFLKQDDFDAALEFIATCELKAPVKKEPKPVPMPQQESSHNNGQCPCCGCVPIPDGSIVLSREDAERIRTFIYQWKYVFRRPLDVAYEFLCAVDSPMRGRFWEAVHDLNLSLLEATLERQGLPALSRP